MWIDAAQLTGDMLKAAKAQHIEQWLNKMQHAFGAQSRTVKAMFRLRQIAEREPEVLEVLLSLSKFDGYEDSRERSIGGGHTCVKESKPEGIWQKPTGAKAPQWEPGKNRRASTLF